GKSRPRPARSGRASGPAPRPVRATLPCPREQGRQARDCRPRPSGRCSDMAEFFQAWRRRQAEKQAAEWNEEQEEARRAVQELPDVLQARVRVAVEKLIDGPDADVEGA